ncbi:MAG: hypothetical protein SFV15_22340 [Polyangiaceae bacterium]|nr:hypothetical protein [Polyangiaceae bacterium]
MKTTKIALIALLAPALIGGIASTACSDVANAAGPLDGLAAQCGLVCDAEGIVEGNAQISGIRSIDAFFNAVLEFNGQATLVSGNIEAQLARIRGALGVTTNAEIKAALTAKLTANVEGKARIVAEPPKCEVSAKATLEAQAKCDASVDPGSASVKCSGSCVAEASASASCDAMATLKCSGTAPMLSCSGTCKASCEGTCMLDGKTKCEGTCAGTLNADGTCMGECTVAAGGKCNGTCSGKCTGECEYTPPMGVMCSAGAEVKCEAMANAQVECKGKCEGEVTPPMVKAECNASAKASAEVKAECSPPKLYVEFTAKAGLDAAAKADFAAFTSVFVDAYGQILAQQAQAKGIIKAGGTLTAAATAAAEGLGQVAIDGDLKAKIGAGCAIPEMGKVGKLIGDATGKLNTSVMDVAAITTTVGG